MYRWLMSLVLVMSLGLPLAVSAQVPVSPTTVTARVSQTSISPSMSAAGILQRLKRRNQIPPDLAVGVKVVPSNQYNAYTNGQNIIVTDKLWNALKTDDQRAFVIGHELGHILANHIQKTQFRRVGMVVLDQYVLERYLPQNSLWGLVSNIGMSLADKYSSRNMEYQADDLGLQMMKRAGYRPRAAIQVLLTLEKLQGTHMPGFLMDHPTDKARISRLVEKYEIGR